MISIEIYDSFEATVKLWYIWTWVSSVIARAAGRNWHLFAGKVSSLYRPDTLLLIEYFSIDIKDSQLPLSVISPFRFMIVLKPQTNDDLLNVKPSHRIKATRPTHIQRGCQQDFLLHSCLCVSTWWSTPPTFPPSTLQGFSTSLQLCRLLYSP